MAIQRADPFPLGTVGALAAQNFILTKPGGSAKMINNRIPEQAMMGRRHVPSPSENRWLVRTGGGKRADTDPGAACLKYCVGQAVTATLPAGALLEAVSVRR